MFSPQSRLRHAVADTFAMVVYCSVVNMLIEIFLSGMSFEQSLYSRLVAIPVNILIAWPYGMYRDLFMRAARKACLRSAAIIRLKPDTLLRDWHCQSRY